MNSHHATWGWVLLCVFAGCTNASIGGPEPLADSGAPSDSASTLPDASSQSVDAALPGPPDAALPDASLPCIGGTDRVEDPTTGHCYIFFADLRTWDVARLVCDGIGAHLVVSTSQAENDVFSPLAGLTDVWAGGTDVEVEGQWQWLTGEPGIYTNWRTGEPNNSNELEHCMVIEGDNGGLWDDRPCDRNYGFICERE